MEQLSRTLRLIEDGIERRLHIGAQVYVSVAGKCVADVAVGQARPGKDLDRDALMLWMSAGKPVTAIAVAQLCDQGKVKLDDPVAKHVPAFAQNGKGKITIRHCLTHTAGLRGPLNNFTSGTWEQIIDRVCAMRPEPNWVPGEKAGYHVGTTWFILGEVVARASGEAFSDYVRRHIFLPLGMNDAWIGMPVERYLAYGDRLALLPTIEKGDLLINTPANTDQATIVPRPGANLRSPANQFARFYEMLLAGGVVPAGARSAPAPGARLLSADTVREFTSPQRVGMYDQSFQAPLDWSLGFLINHAPYSAKTPYLYGPHASAGTFGHSGNQSSVAFGDPEKGLAVAIAFNGMPGEAAHQERVRGVLTVLYEELGLARG